MGSSTGQPIADLRSRLERFELDDPGASLSFSKRLARENGWSHTYALRVVEEYKRFVFLAMTAGHEVTPSEEVDQAWHLHLTYTRSYWDELCGRVLGAPLHHGPTKGGDAEGRRFEDQYEQTLASYREAFGEDPPGDIWPPTAVRFGEAAHFVRVNTKRNWVINRPFAGRKPVLIGGPAAVGVLGTAQPGVLGEIPYSYLFLAFVAVLVVILIRLSSTGGGGGGSGCGGWFGCGGSGCGGSGCGGGGCGGGCGGS